MVNKWTKKGDSTQTDLIKSAMAGKYSLANRKGTQFVCVCQLKPDLPNTFFTVGEQHSQKKVEKI